MSVQPIAKHVDPDEVWSQLITTLNADNGGKFAYTSAQAARARPHIEKLIEEGYFADSTTDLDGSFWQLAAGEETDAAEFFMRAPDAYMELGDVLNAIFNGETV